MKTTKRQHQRGHAPRASRPHRGGRHQTSARFVPDRDLWAELLFSGDRTRKVWFYQKFPGIGWRPAGTIEWHNGSWNAEGAGRVVLEALRDGRLADELGVLPEDDPDRVVAALTDIYTGPRNKAAIPFNTF